VKFRVQGSGFRVQGLRFIVRGLGVRGLGVTERKLKIMIDICFGFQISRVGV